MTDFLINKIKNLKKYIKFTKKDLYFGISLLVATSYFNDVISVLNGFLTIKIPHNKEDVFYYKKMLDGKEVILYLSKEDLVKQLFFVIKKNNVVLGKGYCVIPTNYYDSKLGLSIKNNNIKCFFGKDELSKYFDKKRLKRLEQLLKNNEFSE